MRDTQIPRPLLIALIGAIVVGGFFFYQSTKNSEEAPPPPPTQPAPTGATGASGETGASGPTMTAAEKKAAARKQARKELIEQAEAAGMPVSVFGPLQDGKIVLVFFWEPKGADDQKVDDSVDYVKSKYGKRMVVIREKIQNKSRYDGIAKVADITQTPGVLLLYGERANTWQGYIDGKALHSRVERLVGDN